MPATKAAKPEQDRNTTERGRNSASRVIRSDDAAAAADAYHRIVRLEAAMQTHTGALPLAVERSSESRWRRTTARSLQHRCDIAEFDKCDIGREAHPPINKEVGIGPTVVASAWLAFCVIAVIHQLIASGN
jgi:hypothetical protein